MQIASLLPGPLAARLLSDLGADVVIIENPKTGDPLRATLMGPEVGASMFESLNRGKRSVCVDFRDKEQVASLHKRWIAFANVLLISARPGSLDFAGLEPTRLRTLYPSLIVCYLTGYGYERTPLARRAGHDLNYLAQSGVLGMAVEPLRPLPTQVADLLGAHAAVSHILAAVIRQRQTGKGAFLDVSMTDVAGSALVVSEAARVVTEGIVDLTKGGSTLCGGAPCYDVYPTQDGRHVVVCALEGPYWRRVVALLGLPATMASRDHQFATGEAGERVRAQLTEAIRRRTWDDWRQVLQTHDAMMDVVLTPKEAAASSHFQTRGSITSQRDQVPSAVWRIDGEPLSRTDAAPNLGSTSLELGWSHL